VTLVRNIDDPARVVVDEEEDDEDSSSESLGENRFEDDILILKNYSFISVNADNTTFEMHRLVQLAMQTWLASHSRVER
jgi:hypothetical protein